MVETRRGTAQKSKKVPATGTTVKETVKSKRKEGLAAGRNLRAQMETVERSESSLDSRAFLTGEDGIEGGRSVDKSRDDQNPSRLSVAHSENSLTPEAPQFERPNGDLLLLETPVVNEHQQEIPFVTCKLPTRNDRRHSFSGADGDSANKQKPVQKDTSNPSGPVMPNAKRPASTQPAETPPIRPLLARSASKGPVDNRTSPVTGGITGWLRNSWGNKKGNMNERLEEVTRERDEWVKERDEAVEKRDSLNEELLELRDQLQRNEQRFANMYGDKELEVLRVTEMVEETKTRLDGRIKIILKAKKAVEKQLAQKEARRRRTEDENAILLAKNVILTNQNDHIQRTSRMSNNNTSFRDLGGTGNTQSVILENLQTSGQVSHSSRSLLRGQATLPNQPRQRTENPNARMRTSETHLNGTGTLHQSRNDSVRDNNNNMGNVNIPPDVTGNPAARLNVPNISRSQNDSQHRSISSHNAVNRSHAGDSVNRTRTTQLSSRIGVNGGHSSQSHNTSATHQSSRTQSRASHHSTARDTTADTLVTANSSMHNGDCGGYHGRGGGGPPDPGGPDSSSSENASRVHPGDRSGARAYTPTPHPGPRTTPHRGGGRSPRREITRSHSRRRHGTTGRFSAKHIREDHIFHGYSEENFEEWVLKAKILCRLEAGSEDYFYSHLFFFLDGTPKQYYLQWAELDGHHFRTENVVRGLRAIYGNINNQLSRISAYERMRQGSMTLFEFVTAFQVAFTRATPGSIREPGKADRMFMEFLKKVNPGEKALVQQFMNGMNEPDWDELASRIRKNMRRYTEDDEVVRPVVHTGVRVVTPVERDTYESTMPVKTLAGVATPPPAPFMSEPTGTNRAKLCKYIQNTVKNGGPLTVQDLLEKLAGFSKVDVYYVVMACLDGSLGVEVRHTGMEAMTHFPEVFNKFACDAERERMAKLALEGSPVVDAAKKFERDGSRMRRTPRSTKPGELSFYADKSRRPAKPPPYFVCHTCKKKGHYRDECPEAKKEDDGEDEDSGEKKVPGLVGRTSKVITLVMKNQTEPDWNVAGGPKSYATYLAEWAKEENLPFPPNNYANLPEFLYPFDSAFPYAIWRERYFEWLDDSIAEVNTQKPYVYCWTAELDNMYREKDTTPRDWEKMLCGQKGPLLNEETSSEAESDECFNPWTEAEHMLISGEAEVTDIVIGGLFDMGIDNEMPLLCEYPVTESVTVPQDQSDSDVYVTAPNTERFSEKEIFLEKDEVPIFDINTRLSNKTLHATVLTAAPDWEVTDPESVIFLQPMELALRILDRIRGVQRCAVASLVDSGSALTIMQRAAYLRAGGRIEDLLSCKHKVMTGFGGDIHILGRALMPFVLDNLEFSQTVHVINDDERLPLIILGLDWLKRHKVFIDFNTHIMSLYNMSIQLGKPRQKCNVPCLAGVDEGKEEPPKEHSSPYPRDEDDDYLDEDDRKAIASIKEEAKLRHQRSCVETEAAEMVGLLEEASDAMMGLQWALPEAWDGLRQEQKDVSKEGLWGILAIYASVAPIESGEGHFLTKARRKLGRMDDDGSEMELSKEAKETLRKQRDWRLRHYQLYDETRDEQGVDGLNELHEVPDRLPVEEELQAFGL